MALKKISAILLVLVLSLGTAVLPTNVQIDFPISASAANETLSAPKNVKASVTGIGKVTLTWDKVKGADGYRVYMYDSNTKTYNKYKTITGNQIEINVGIKNAIAYKFKIAAVVKSGSSYKVGKASAVVSAVPKYKSGLKMKAASSKASDLNGSWTFYDFSETLKYNQGTKYDPSKIQYDDELYLLKMVVSDGKTAAISNYYLSSENRPAGVWIRFFEIKNNEFNLDGMLDCKTVKYKIYSYGEDKFLFLQWITDGEEETYIFKYENSSDNKTQIKDISKLNGSWTTVDFCDFDFAYSDIYDPDYPQCGDMTFYLKDATIKNGKITFRIFDEASNKTIDGMTATMNKSTINDGNNSKYYVYEINGDVYMYYQWIAGDGYGHFYVLKKDK